MRATSRPFASAAAAILHSYYQLIGPSLVVTIRFPAGDFRSDQHAGATRAVLDQSTSQPCFYALWTSDHLNLMALPYASTALREFTRQFSFFADDSFGGLVMRNLLARLGAGCIAVSQADAVVRLRILRQVIENKISGFLVVDGRGPYFEVGSGLPNLAKATRAAIVPCAAVSEPAVRVPNNRVTLTMPTRQSRIILAFGAPILPAESASDALALAHLVKDSINHTREMALRSFQPRDA